MAKMFYSSYLVYMDIQFFSRLVLFFLTLVLGVNASFAEQVKLHSPQAYINLAISKQKTDANAAVRALEKAYKLAQDTNNTAIIPKILLEQAQTAKLKKDYFLAQQYLNRVEKISKELNDIALSVDILTNMSSVQRYLKNYDRSMEYVQKALSISRENSKELLIFKSLHTKGALFKAMKRNDDSVRTLLEAQRYIAGISVSNKIRLYRDIAGAYKRLEKLEPSIQYFNKARELLTTTDDKKKLTKTLIDIAKLEAKRGDFTSSLVNTRQALTLSNEIDDEKSLLKSSVLLSILYRKLSSYEDALKHGQEALRIYKKNNDVDGIASAANAVGLIYIHLGQNKIARSYFNLVIELPEKSLDVKYKAAALRDLGKIIFDESRSAEGLKLSNDAYTLYEKIANKNGVATVQKNLGFIYYHIGNTTEARRSYNIAIDLFHSMSDLWNEAESKAYLAATYIDSDVEKAKSLATDSLKQAKNISAKSIEEHAYSVLVSANEKQNNYEQALQYAKKKAEIVEEIQSEALTKKLSGIHTILLAKKQEQELKSLTRKKELLSLEQAQQEFTAKLQKKEAAIEELNNQKLLVSFAIIIFVFGGIYFKMHYYFILPAVTLLSLLLYVFNT